MMRRFLVVFSVAICLICNKITAQTASSNSERFPTTGHKEVTILKKTNVNADTLKTLLIVPNNTSWIEIGKKLNYFKEVMTLSELQKDIIAKGLSDKIPSISDKIGLYNAYKNYKPFVILINSNEDLKAQGFRTRLSLYDPMRSDMIFRNEVRLNLMWEGYSDKKVLNPLLNSLVDYLSEQK
ncbi:hypothetical protein [Niabella ginsengisoli]|uniref:Uncharacterized protein n=1 Tax=Niabella ginsengisoli TaxID=522298 RepID=A0ABS9SIA7_9BACT|nr:hypothetical protein [Niabella ginsengisoli]MCH5598098.1 hypothetical protein [Niabella ginsengisoli]